MKDIGLVGVPYSGKSTLFTALTRAGAAGGRANQAVVPVPDPRLGVLAELEGARRRAKSRGAHDVAEVAALERAQAALAAETPLVEAGLDEEERKALRGLAPLTLKPWVLVANLQEGAGVPAWLPAGTVGVSAEIEAETAGMSPEEARELLAEFGVAAPGLDRVVAACYRAIDLITFLTTGEDETRAWEVRRGAHAPEAAGVIHTDLERGFIRAEVVTYDDLVAAGGWDAAKAQGHLRVEGRDYVVREGDVLHVRFAV